jgi:nuclear transport factor 2 (NTF2) superfamily protein
MELVMLNRACNTAWEPRNCQDAHLQNTCDKLYRVLLERIFFTRKKGLTCTGKWDLEKAYLLKREPEWWDDALEMNYYSLTQ